MLRRISSGLAVTVLVAVAATGAPAQKGGKTNRQGNLKQGDTAPNFTLKDVDGKQSITLSKLTGKPVVLIFGSCT